MLYYIEDSVVEAAENGNTIVRHCLSDLYYCWSKGFCIIGSSRSNLDRLVKVNGLESYAFVQKTVQGIQYLYSELAFFVVLIYKENKGHPMSCYANKYREIDICSLKSILNISLNFIVCENVSDFDFYICMTEKINENLYNQNFHINVLPFNGGGSTTVVSLKHVKDYFCLTICDSDIKYEGCKRGNTCKDIFDYVSSLRMSGKNNIWMHTLTVHEAENLIPFGVLKKISPKGVIKQITNIKSKNYGDTFLSYFDFKEGFKESIYRKIKSLNDDVFIKYQKLLLDVGKKEADLKRILKKKYSKGKDNCIIPGLGPSVLSDTISYIDTNNVSCQDLAIDSYQQKDLNEISSKIWSLGCAITPKYV